MVKLRVKADGRSVTLHDTPLLIGRSPYCSLATDDASVSRLHALVRWIDGVAEIRDLGSANGTWLNGWPITGPVPLKPGDTVRLGSVSVRIEAATHQPSGPTDFPGSYEGPAVETKLHVLEPVHQAIIRPSLSPGAVSRPPGLPKDLPEAQTNHPILIAAQDTDVAVTLGTALAAYGMVTFARSVAEARRATSKSVPRVVLIEPELQDGDAISFVGELRKRFPWVRILAVCSVHWLSQTGTLITAGVHDIVFKPFDAGTLVPRVLLAARAAMTAQQEASYHREVESRLRHADRLVTLGTLCATVANEMRNPLVAARTECSFVRDTLATGGTDSAMLAECRDAVVDLYHAIELIDAIVATIRGLAGRSDELTADVPLAEAVRLASLMLRPRVAAVGVTIRWPEGAGPVVRHAPTAVAQALINVVANAIDAAGVVGGAVTVRYVETQGVMGISVEDTGLGVADDVLQRMREPFFTTKTDGLGLGLTVAQGIMKDLNGTLSIERRPDGRGLTVSLLFPSSQEKTAVVDRSTDFDDPKDQDSTRMYDISALAETAKGVDATPYLIVVKSRAVAGRMFRISGKMVLGRKEDTDIRIDDEGVSRRHVQITVRPDGAIEAADLNSTNGTFCNGDRITRRILQDGDKLQIGDATVLKFSYQDALDEALQSNLFESATRDGLTGAHNKKTFEEVLQKEFAYSRRHRLPLALLLLDVDYFKRINDTYGHPAGDVVLKHLVQTIAECLRVEDMFARYGGEEFAILLRETPSDRAVLCAERICRTVAKSKFMVGGTAMPVTVSLGVAVYGGVEYVTPQALVEAADRCLYQAKQAGRNRVVRVVSP